MDKLTNTFDFNTYGKKVFDFIDKYFKSIEGYPVIAQVNPGDIAKQLPAQPPLAPDSMEDILRDFEDIIIPGITHWNHPMFMAMFNSTSTGPGILAEALTAALNANGFLWMGSPSLTELENVVLKWFGMLVGVPGDYFGIIYDSASTSTMHAIAAARELVLNKYDFKHEGFPSGTNLKLRIYCSEFAHSSVDKGAMVLGVGLNNVIKIKTDKNLSMIPDELEKAIKQDREKGYVPFCVVATAGTTSFTSIDPIDAIGSICSSENIWLHIDGAYGGSSAILEEMKYIFKGIEKADSVVINPHKWFFNPTDISLFYTKKPEVLKDAFSIVPEYLKTNNEEAVNLMDYGFQLGRRFRALKLWFTIRYYGVENLKGIIREHISLAKMFEKLIVDSNEFELIAPVPFSTVCFRYNPGNMNEEQLNSINKKIMDNLNKSGKIYLSHTKLKEKYVIRLVVAGFYQKQEHIMKAWKLIKETVSNL
ncbi:MAG: pyridoxal-dependent decarboxylase [Bacteroidota bacterium]|nr:pyridoxal-dependent decarboxylase [Bacteroidota bacterium]